MSTGQDRDDDLQNYRYDMWEEYRSKIPALEQIPVVSGIDYSDINMGKLIQLKPDVVIWTLAVQQTCLTWCYVTDWNRYRAYWSSLLFFSDF
jgi:hypothetical protein